MFEVAQGGSMRVASSMTNRLWEGYGLVIAKGNEELHSKSDVLNRDLTCWV